MPDPRKHRGPHPEDRRLFAATIVPRLRAACRDQNWLLSRGYPPVAALKLVGDRYRLAARQRLAIARCACGKRQQLERAARRIASDGLAQRALWIDGYNVLTTLEAALAGGVILQATDGCFRDMASMHGSYRKVAETLPAIMILGELLARWQPSECIWWLDQPVSNSGRLGALLRDTSAEHGWSWQVRLVPDPDRVLVDGDQIVASADSQVLDQVENWFNLAREAIESRVAHAWIAKLAGA